MARFLTSDWAGEVSAALAELTELPAAVSEASVMASGGEFTVAQVVRGVPSDLPAAVEGVVTTLLTVHEGRAALSVEPGPSSESERASVTITIEYEHAVALNRGELKPAEALAHGDLRVRGDLSVLVAGQHLLATAGARLHAVQAATTY